jgi:hypothetical protein
MVKRYGYQGSNEKLSLLMPTLRGLAETRKMAYLAVLGREPDQHSYHSFEQLFRRYLKNI